jgi:hypothetical protein
MMTAETELRTIVIRRAEGCEGCRLRPVYSARVYRISTGPVRVFFEGCRTHRSRIRIYCEQLVERMEL